jgi:transcriptional regulator with XRE-family HTH domain
MGTQSTSSPTVAKIALGALMKRIRERAGKEPVDVAALLGIDRTTYTRWESGKFSPKPISIPAIADAIGATPEEMSRMSTLALDSKQRGLFEGASVPPDLRVLYETEAIATLILALELEHIPGLLQTPEYHRKVQDALLAVPPDTAETFRSLRTQRQKIMFNRSRFPRMQFIIGMSAMLYLDQHPEIKDGQIARLREVNALRGIDIRVVTGFHAGMLGSFTILTPPDNTGARPFAYVESLEGGRYVEGDVVSQFEGAFRLIYEQQSQKLEEYLR